MNYCHTHTCLTAYILDYFNDTKPEKMCERCSNCLDNREKTDITEEAQKILSCVKRMGERYGVSLTAKVLKGSRDKKISNFRLHTISTYGILSAYTEKELTEWIHFLIAEQMLSVKEGKFPTLMLNKNSVDILKGKRTVWMYTAPVPTTGEADYDEQLFSILRTLRKEMADRDNVPPYVLFSDMTLKECCRYFPETKEDMLDIKGIGEKKFETYGPPFLEKIITWRKKYPDVKPARKINDFRGPAAKKQPAQQTDGPSHMESYQLFQ